MNTNKKYATKNNKQSKQQTANTKTHTINKENKQQN